MDVPASLDPATHGLQSVGFRCHFQMKHIIDSMARLCRFPGQFLDGMNRDHAAAAVLIDEHDVFGVELDFLDEFIEGATHLEAQGDPVA